MSQDIVINLCFPVVNRRYNNLICETQWGNHDAALALKEYVTGDKSVKNAQALNKKQWYLTRICYDSLNNFYFENAFESFSELENNDFIIMRIADANILGIQSIDVLPNTEKNCVKLAKLSSLGYRYFRSAAGKRQACYYRSTMYGIFETVAKTSQSDFFPFLDTLVGKCINYNTAAYPQLENLRASLAQLQSW